MDKRLEIIVYIERVNGQIVYCWASQWVNPVFGDTTPIHSEKVGTNHTQIFASILEKHESDLQNPALSRIITTINVPNVVIGRYPINELVAYDIQDNYNAFKVQCHEADAPKLEPKKEVPIYKFGDSSFEDEEPRHQLIPGS
jgi:hypothetical protein